METRKVLWTRAADYIHGIDGRWPVCPHCRCGMETTGKKQWTCINQDCEKCEGYSYEHHQGRMT